jgi:hypothetical protein
LSQICPFCTRAAFSLIPIPTGIDPVKATNRTFGCSTSASPIAPPGPERNWSAPGGTPASSRISKMVHAVSGASLLGFKIAVLPVTRVAAVIPIAIAQGKFQGGITAPTPRGRYS